MSETHFKKLRRARTSFVGELKRYVLPDGETQCSKVGGVHTLLASPPISHIGECFLKVILRRGILRGRIENPGIFDIDQHLPRNRAPGNRELNSSGKFIALAWAHSRHKAVGASGRLGCVRTFSDFTAASEMDTSLTGNFKLAGSRVSTATNGIVNGDKPYLSESRQG